jgi:hypothetical protein
MAEKSVRAAPAAKKRAVRPFKVDVDRFNGAWLPTKRYRFASKEEQKAFIAGLVAAATYISVTWATETQKED